MFMSKIKVDQLCRKKGKHGKDDSIKENGSISMQPLPDKPAAAASKAAPAVSKPDPVAAALKGNEQLFDGKVSLCGTPRRICCTYYLVASRSRAAVCFTRPAASIVSSIAYQGTVNSTAQTDRPLHVYTAANTCL